MERRNKKILWIVLTAVFGVLFAALIAGTCVANYYYVMVDRFLGCERTVVKYYDAEGNEVDGSNFTDGKFLSDYESAEALAAAQNEVGEALVAEGAVLLKNDNALPLDKGKKVSCFSHSSVDIVYGSVGSGAIDSSSNPDLKSSLTDAGLSVNDKLWDFYAKGAGSGYKRQVPGVAGGSDKSFKVNEAPWEKFGDTETSSFKSFGDAAIVVLSRTGGEGADWAQNMSHEYKTAEGDHNGFLSLSDEEKTMLSEIGKLKKSGTFGRVIVILNSANAMETGFLDNADYGIDAALWIGNVGQKGLNAVGDILVGDVNPSGRLVDTYASCAKSAPAVENSGDFSFTNKTGVNSGNKFLVEEEGVYVGYRYYETRYEDCVLGNGKANSATGAFDSSAGWNYAEEVLYPFGYGMSYTNFEYSGFEVNENADSFDLSVTVRNAGGRAGKDVVQFYFQSPYDEYEIQNKVEKPAIELCGFGKTAMLDKGASETVTAKVMKEDLRAYDYVNAKTYILSEGDYYFAFGTNAHDALNNVLAAKGKTTADGMTANGNSSFTYKWNNPTLDKETYAKDSVTENGISNLFAKASLDAYGIEQKVLSRSDWEGTYPTPYNGTYHSTSKTLTATDAMITDLKDEYKTDASVTEMPKMGEKNDASLSEARGLTYGDDLYGKLLDQLTWDDMVLLVATSGYGTPGIAKIDKPATVDSDGPAGISGELYGGKSGVGYAAQAVISSTWNVELIEKMGKMVGEDGLLLGAQGWYAPAVNIHRNAFSGRNYEYYSEDPFLSGVAAAATVKGAQAKGMYVYVKHFALNDQETNRIGVSTFAKEQAIREIYLEPFEIAVQQGGAHGIMSSFNRIGCQWTGASRELLTDVLRTEWGFDGHVVTDFSGLSSSYMRIETGLKAGNDCWLSTSSTYVDKLNAYKKDAAMANWLRQACRRILYTVANSAAMNPYIVESGITAKTVDVLPWWQPTLVTIDVVLGLATAAFAVMLVLTLRKKKQGEISQ